MTDRYLVFGNPIAHSMSPQLHAFFAQQTGEDISYGRELVEPGCFASQADAFFADGGRGCNITVPCKLDAYSYADTLSEYARAAGAVNTLKKLEDGSIYGDNTDGRGLVYDLKRLRCPLEGARILVIGAGGAAQGILKPLLEESPAALTVANRTYEKAKALSELYEGRVKAASLSESGCEYDVIINATSSSLKDEMPGIDEKVFSLAQFAYDLMYRKEGRTIFTKRALELGTAQAHDGFGMLIGQAILSFELWRGVRPDFNAAIERFRS